ncbi:hypothetical protein LXL04_027762 [Taraxacum kok-saghyz]
MCSQARSHLWAQAHPQHIKKKNLSIVICEKPSLPSSSIGICEKPSLPSSSIQAAAIQASIAPAFIAQAFKLQASIAQASIAPAFKLQAAAIQASIAPVFIDSSFRLHRFSGFKLHRFCFRLHRFCFRLQASTPSLQASSIFRHSAKADSKPSPSTKKFVLQAEFYDARKVLDEMLKIKEAWLLAVGQLSIDCSARSSPSPTPPTTPATHHTYLSHRQRRPSHQSQCVGLRR